MLWTSRMMLRRLSGNQDNAKTTTMETSKAWVRDCFLIFSLKRVFCKANTLLPFLLSSILDSCKNAKIVWQPLLIGYVFAHTKGQLISKCLFGVFKFFQKTNENKLTWGIIVVKLDFFVCFLEELRIHTKKSFWN